MNGFWHGAIGLILALAGWIAPRRLAGADRLGVAALLDAAPLAFVVTVLCVALGRPIFAGVAVFALGTGFAFADWVMRDSLREPVVFSALSELPQVFTHPHLYLPFAGTGSVLGGVIGALFAGVGLLFAEPPLTRPHPLGGLILFGLVACLLWRLGREPWLGRAATALRRLRSTGEPFADAARLGPVAMLITHGILARAERPARRALLAPRLEPGAVAAGGPIVLVQCESFFDARRALPRLPRDFLAGFDAACRGGVHGRLDVPAWGANTMRAEFAALTGIDDTALGYDRFNPYHALARQPIASHVWRLRAAGYHTICLHPYDRRFFRRDLVMPALGFEQFFGRETLGGSRTPPYQSDPDFAGHILRIIEDAGPRVFVFAITMGNHGPWHARSAAADVAVADCVDDDIPQRAELLRYLACLRSSDTLLRLLVERLERYYPEATLGFYGDHLPSLPRAFARLGFDDWRSDYAIWAGAAGHPRRGDLAAHQLGHVLVDLALARRHAPPLAAVVP